MKKMYQDGRKWYELTNLVEVICEIQLRIYFVSVVEVMGNVFMVM